MMDKCLQFLDLGDNGIREIEPETFTNLRNLQMLRLRGNHLTRVPTGALQNLGQLRVLTLQENSIGGLCA